jgi:hypothetical protein
MPGYRLHDHAPGSTNGSLMQIAGGGHRRVRGARTGMPLKTVRADDGGRADIGVSGPTSA